MNNLNSSHNKILKTIKAIEPRENYLHQIRRPKMNDIQLVSLSLTAEYLGVYIDYKLFRRLQNSLSMIIERSVYNKRKRKLFFFIKSKRSKISKAIISDEEFHIVDSMPLEICKMSRKNALKICREHFDTAPNESFCASQQMRYFGYKLHAVCTIQGVFRSFDLSKASVHDIHYLNNIKNEFQDVTILGDKGHLGKQIQLDLFNYSRINLSVPMRKNKHDFVAFSKTKFKIRKRIEKTISHLNGQLLMHINLAKTFQGLDSRIALKITSFTTIQYLNFFVFKRS